MLRLHALQRIWDTFNSKVPIERAYLRYVEVSHVLVLSLYSIAISVPDPWGNCHYMNLSVTRSLEWVKNRHCKVEKDLSENHMVSAHVERGKIGFRIYTILSMLQMMRNICIYIWANIPQ